MPYGTLKADTLTFTNSGVDQSITVSGIVSAISGGITVTGTVSGSIIQGGVLVSGATVTGGVGQFTTIAGETAGFTTVTGITATFISGNFTNISGGTHTITSGVFASGTAANPSISFISDPNTGIYSPGADQVAISTNGTGRLSISSVGLITAATGRFVVGTTGSSAGISDISFGALTGGAWINTPSGKTGYLAQAGTGAYTWASDRHTWSISGSECMRLDSSGRLGLGTSSPAATLEIINGTDNSEYFRAGCISNASTRSIRFSSAANTGGTANARHIINSPSSAGELLIQTASTNALFIDSSQQVGIGTTAPTAELNVKLDTDGVSNILDLENSATSLTPEAVLRMGRPGTSGRRVAIRAIGGTNFTSPQLAFDLNESERMRIDASGRLLVGTSTSFDLGASVQSVGTGAYRFEGFRFGSDNGVMILGSANGTQASPSVLTSPNLGLGIIQFRSYDGAAYRDGAWISAVAESQWASSDCPTRLTFSTTADGASSPTERMRIDSTGAIAHSFAGTAGTAVDAVKIVGSPSYLGANSEARLVLSPHSATRSVYISCLNTSSTSMDFVVGTSNSAAPAERLRVSSAGTTTLTSATSTAPFIANISATEVARIDSSGRLLVGTSTSNQIGALDTQIQLAGTSGGSSLLSLQRYSNNVSSAGIYIGKSRGTSAGSFTAVQEDDVLGDIRFYGANGTDLSNLGARISAEVDGEPFTGGDTTDLPGRLVFYTTADGAGSPTERMRITSAGVLQVAEAGNIAVGTTTGTKIGTATTQKIGFYNATPVVQPTAVADATDAASVITQLNALLTRMRTLGLIAT